MKKLLLAGVAFFSLTAGGPASAADVPVRPVYKAPPAAAAIAPFNWSRCYVGVHGGYGWGHNTNDFGTAVASGPTEAFEAFPAEFGPFHHNTQGWLFGGQAGCNWQFTPNWLIGVEGELKWSRIRGSFTAPEDGFPVGDPGQFSRFESRNLWDGDLAWPRPEHCFTPRPAWRLAGSTTPKRTTISPPRTDVPVWRSSAASSSMGSAA
jgi:opacity protein-like surface antigen